MKGNTKEQIKNRMIQNAASLWGVAASDIEMSFDPIVSLLIGSCASEIEKISNIIEESQANITEKFIQLMTPEAVIGPRPASAIIYAETIEPSTVIKPEYQFYFKKKVSQKNASVNIKNIYFSPIQNFKLVNAAVKYMASGGTIIEIEKKNRQKLIAKLDPRNQLPSSTIYLGISSKLSTLFLDEVSFYFELLDVNNKELFYHHLRNAEWDINGSKIEVVNGFGNTEKFKQVKLNSIFVDTSEKTNNICGHTGKIYEKHYVTIKGLTNKKGIKKSNYSVLENIIRENKLKIDDDIRWIKIEFPKIVTNLTLAHVFCSLNSFPVINRELNNFTYRIKEYINIIPIKTEDLFLDVKSISNLEGKDYKSRDRDNSDLEKGTFTLRNENIGKLDQRKAREHIMHLIELLKDESAAFSFINNNFLHKNLRDLNQLISLLEKKVSEVTNEETETTFAFVKPYKKNETLLIEFWSTNGSDANNIKAGNELDIYKAVGLKHKSASLISTTIGGKDNLNVKNRLNAYRRALLSRDRVVTKEDIKALCYEMYSDKIEKVEVRRGYLEDLAVNKGLIQCIEILMYPNKRKRIEQQEWEAINSNLLLYLEKNSINVFPYKIKTVN